MRILFLDQSASLGGAELCLLDIVKSFPYSSILVGLLAEGSFYRLLQQDGIPSKVLMEKALAIHKESNFLQGLSSLHHLLPLGFRTGYLAKQYDLIYVNTPKALIVGALASVYSGKPLVYHLHDIISPDHFSRVNRCLLITLANLLVTLVIANSKATRDAFIHAGGHPNKVFVVYNGFRTQEYYQKKELLHWPQCTRDASLDKEFSLRGKFVIGHFSRLAPWKGQHVLIQALSNLPDDFVALFVGDALFGEVEYVRYLHEMVDSLGLRERVHFLGFQSDVPTIMGACDLVAHTSTAPEPFGRVIVEAMLCARPVVAAAAGGAVELVKPGETGWLCPPNDPIALAEIIRTCANHPEESQAIALEACKQARVRFDLAETNRQIQELLSRYEKPASV